MYPYFSFNTEEEEKEHFPNEELWIKACKDCSSQIVQDFYAAEWRYKQLLLDKNFDPEHAFDNMFTF